MTTQGDTRSISADPDPAGEHLRSGSRGGRRLLIWCVALAVLGAGGWVVTRPNPGDWLPGLGPSSKDERAPVLGTPAPTSATDPNPFTVDRYFPRDKSIDLDAYKGRRSGGRQGNDCNETLQDPTKTVLRDAGCQGYLAVSFSRLDGKVWTSVTVLRFADEQASAKAADLMRGQPGLLKFVQPDGSTAASSPTPGANNESAPRIGAVRHYVTITTSHFADGHAATGPADPDLTEATAAGAYTAEAAFMWS
jgi:hypothetical protein